ncbi:MAG: Rne/Rng family ribonuclease [Pyrinomonadaceae bacterium]
MSKEMIISVNGREKKIAILDNGRASEFYIERGDEENAGIVGNIYKGRVQRVLPGMQSAFVEIGLERDAFLYVSDFFDEEEEIERIVMEKSKKSSPEDAVREATDRIQRARLEREKQMESAQELAEPLTEIVEEVKSDENEDVAESTETLELKETEEAEKVEEIEETQSKNRRGRSRRGRKSNDGAQEKPQFAKEKEERKSEIRAWEENAPLFEMEDSGFERIIDDEETTGDMFKDAYMQEAIIDQVRAIEFDMESAATAEVGSLIGAFGEAENKFERIADEDEEQQTAAPKTGNNRGNRGGRNRGKSAKVTEANKEKTETKSAKKDSTNKSTASKNEKPTSKSVGEDKETKSSSRDGKSKTTTRGNKKSAKDKTLENAEAGVKESSDVAEMAVRRGGRGRRRTGSDPQTKPEETSSTEKTDTRYQSGNGRRDNRRERPPQPTITDLLREGQEILVQIAKEPIARKGARITSHIALPGRFLVYMPTIEHLGVSRKIESASERARLRTLIQKIKQEEEVPSGGFIVRTAGIGISDEDLRQDAKYLIRTWLDLKKDADKAKSPALVHQDLDIIQRLLRDQLSEEFTAIRVDSEEEYQRIVEFINRIQPRLVNRVKLYTQDEPILEKYGVQEEVDKALKPRVWLKSGGYLVINQTEALVAIDVNTGKFVGRGNARLEDTITKTNMEAVDEIARQIRLRDLGGIIVLDLIDMEDRRNRNKVSQALQEALASDKSPNKVLSFNDFGLIIMTRKRVKQSLERTMCAPCDYCEGAGWIKSSQTICYEILDEARRLAKGLTDIHQTTLRVHPDVARTLFESESTILDEIEVYLGNVDVTGDKSIHQEQFDFAFI